MLATQFNAPAAFEAVFYEKGKSELAQFLFQLCLSNPHEAAILARFGRWFAMQELPLAHELTPRANPFVRSYCLMRDHHLAYCEGWTRILLPRRSAWCSDEWGKVYDKVYKQADDGYFGVALKPDFVRYFKAKYTTQSILSHPCFSSYALKSPGKVVYMPNELLKGQLSPSS